MGRTNNGSTQALVKHIINTGRVDRQLLSAKTTLGVERYGCFKLSKKLDRHVDAFGRCCIRTVPTPRGVLSSQVSFVRL